MFVLCYSLHVWSLFDKADVFYLLCPEEGAIDLPTQKIHFSIFFFYPCFTLSCSFCPAEAHIYCGLENQLRTCEKMKSLLLFFFIFWPAAAELKPRKGKSRPR